MHFSYRLFLFLGLGMLALPACKKDTSSLLPTITISSPVDGQQFSVLDTIYVNTTISDDNGLASYSVTLCNGAFMPVQAAVTATVSSNAVSLQFPYVIDNLQLADGDYYLMVSATDVDNNTERAYRYIHISAIPQVRRGFFLVSTPAFGQLNVSKVDSAWNISSFTAFASDYSSSSINCLRQQLYLCGKQTGMLRALSLPSGSLSWSQTPIPGPSDFFTSVRVMNDFLYVSYRDNAIQAFDLNGTMRYSAIVNSPYYPIKTLLSNNRLYAEHQDPGSSAQKLIVYSGSAGGGLQETLLNVDVVELFARDANSIFVLGNAGGQGKLQIYDFNANGLNEPMSLPAGTILSAAQVDANTLLIAMSNGNVYKFTYNPIGLLAQITGINAQCLRYDPLHSEIITAEQNTLRVFDYAGGALEQTVLNADSIADVHIWYNR
ncbi:MAG: hypothetical protein FD123_642 [Bacteroidetes bacterium]|nr:MAG: hypothetical protein FD123_642 [Bacteroidota bacterium]